MTAWKGAVRGDAVHKSIVDAYNSYLPHPRGHKLTDTIKNIDKIEMMEDDGYSRDGDYSSDGDYSRGGDWQADMRGTYGRGSSYARRGTHYVRGHYSRADSMEHLREQINDMMRETDDDRVKEALRRAASLMEE